MNLSFKLKITINHNRGKIRIQQSNLDKYIYLHRDYTYEPVTQITRVLEKNDVNYTYIVDNTQNRFHELVILPERNVFPNLLELLKAKS